MPHACTALVLPRLGDITKCTPREFFSYFLESVAVASPCLVSKQSSIFFGISISLHPVSMGFPPVENTVKLCLINNTVQSASHMGPTPNRVLVKDGMIYPVFRKYSANCGIGSVAVADNISTCPVAVPTLMFRLLVLGGPCRAVEEM